MAMTARRARTVFVCRECGTESLKWMGRCPGCEAWNTMVEEVAVASESVRTALSAPIASRPVALSEVMGETEERRPVGFAEFDRVLGGGIVPGSLVLLGGDPGVGKSTLLLQVATAYASIWDDVLYVSAEESAKQVTMRARRLGALCPRLYVVGETDLEAILAHIDAMRPGLVVIDSIQTISYAGLSSTPGSVAQTRACTHEIMRMAKSLGIAVFLVGHVNKTGALAGPKVLEHAVDVVLGFEGERYTTFRLLRATKNRYGSTHELGVFNMSDRGLEEVANPSACFLAERPKGEPGSAVVACMEGTRPLLVEIQALVGPAPFGGTPRRQTSGVDRNRSAIVLAVLEKRAGLALQSYDVYISVAGGLTVDEPAVDLGIALAVASSFRGRPVAEDTVVFGEVGLAGELRSVGHCDRRVVESQKLGFRRCIVPRGARIEDPADLTLVPVGRLTQALEAALIDGEADTGLERSRTDCR
jgi:DNA repair protein RadA/Sms